MLCQEGGEGFFALHLGVVLEGLGNDLPGPGANSPVPGPHLADWVDGNGDPHFFPSMALRFMRSWRFCSLSGS